MEYPAAIRQLLEEHDRLRSLLDEARGRISRALSAGADDLAPEDQDFLADLDAFLAVDLEAHIAKEERVLFPPLERASEALLRLCEDMVVQHDEIKVRRDVFLSILAHLHHDHTDVRDAAAAARASLAASPAADGSGLRSLWESLFTLGAILEGHFDDEEGELFPAAAEALSPDAFEAMLPAMRAIDEAADAG